MTDRDQKNPPTRTFDPHFGGERSFDELMFPSHLGGTDKTWADLDGASRTVVGDGATKQTNSESGA